MHSNTDPVEVTLHLTDGRVIVFKQPEGASSRPLFEGAQLAGLFKRELFVLRGEQSVSLFPTDKVVRLDVSRLLPEWVDDAEEIRADQIADYDFQWLRETLAAVNKQFPDRPRLEDVIVAADLELSNSDHIYLRVEFRVDDAGRPPQELLIDQILNCGGLPIRLREGGFGVINPKALVRLTLCPVPEDMKVCKARYVG